MNAQMDIVIEELGLKGDGIGAMPDGVRVFIPGALPGERVRIGALQQRQEGFSAKLEAVLVASPDRASPPCAHFGRCGGCALQQMEADSYSRFKAERVRQALARFDLEAEVFEGVFVSPPGSRRRAVFSARCDAQGVVHLGFNERASHVLAEIEECPVLSPVLVKTLPVLRHFLPRFMKEGESYDVALAESAGAIDLLIAVLGREGRDCNASMSRLLEEMAQEGGFARISWKKSGAAPPRVVVSKSAYSVSFGKFRVVPPPGGFLQPTAEGEALLRGFALSAIRKKSCIADLYAGCGTFALSFLSEGHRVDAFEGDEAALAALAGSAAGQSGLRTARRDLDREPLTFQELKPYDAVTIDPPRLGALSQMHEIARSGVQRVVSVSCNPDSFSRDAKVLVQKGFKLKKLAVIDQFLWSPHVEVAALLVRAG